MILPHHFAKRCGGTATAAESDDVEKLDGPAS